MERKILFVFIVCFTAVCLQGCKTECSNYYLNGRSCKPESDALYLTPGNMAYCVGMQDGSFPDIGGHIEKEMGGLWANPIKLCDGFEFSVVIDSQRTVLSVADEYATFPYGNKFTYSDVASGLSIDRFQFVPDDESGILITYTLNNKSGRDLVLTADFSIRFDLRPSWFSEPKGYHDSEDCLVETGYDSSIAARDLDSGWTAVCTSSYESHPVEYAPAGLETFGLGCTATLESDLIIPSNGSMKLHFAISGSEKGYNEAVQTSRRMLESIDELLDIKIEHYCKVISRAQIDIPDKLLQDCYTYSKINTDWLIQDLGDLHFLAAGAMEYPWLFGCDNSYALQGVICTGDASLAKETLNALKIVSERANGNGRIIHEMSPSGAIYNYGNTQETAHYICAVYYVYQWTGDKEWLDGLYPYMKQGIDWLFTTMDSNANMFPEGYGIMEVKGLDVELVDVAVYSQQALECMSSFAAIYGESQNEAMWRQMASSLKDKINQLFWNQERGLYCDFYGTSDQAERVAQGAALQYPDNSEKYHELASRFAALPKGTEQGFLTNVNWVITVPMETGIAPSDRAIRSLDVIMKENCGKYGPYLSSFDRDHAMTIPTGVQAVSEARYGRIDNAVRYLDMIASTLDCQMPGSICEIMPDYGCPAQAWTIYGPAKVIVNFIFGINPDAENKVVDINPLIPTGWNHISISDVLVGDCAFSMTINRLQSGLDISIDSDSRDYTFILHNSDGGLTRITGKKHYHESI